ncbi:hypothetical protein VTJ04DRAFT_7040 [Mycothermus thermophilus]|uniref:uncharacterized protein n=1 Tax=Humicola insolens TaxID=85995 RepID=UPI0037426768
MAQSTAPVSPMVLLESVYVSVRPFSPDSSLSPPSFGVSLYIFILSFPEPRIVLSSNSGYFWELHVFVFITHKLQFGHLYWRSVKHWVIG